MGNSPATGKNSISEELTVIEQKHFAELVLIVDNGMKTFYEVGMALMQIRDNRYYRKTHGTFEEFCKEKWGFDRTYAHRLIKSSEVVDNLLPTGNIPTSERAVRPLTRIKDPEEQREVYQRAVETAPEGKVTARHIEETAKKTMKPKEPEQKVYHMNPVSDAMVFAGMAISQLQRIQPDDPKRDEALRKVSSWIKKRRAENNRSHK